MSLRTEHDSGRTSDLLVDEVEGKIRVLTFDGEAKSALDQDIAEIHSPASRGSSHIHPITTHHVDDQGARRKPQNMHEPAVKRIPPQILSLIFMYCRKEGETTVILPRAPSHWFPWVLGQVCSQWRQALLSPTEAWSDIEIRSDLPPKKQDVLPWLVDEAMTRAHNLVSLKMPPLEVETFTKIITPYAGRLQSLRLTLSFNLLGTFLNLPLNLPSLGSLEVSIAKSPLPRPAMIHQTDALRKASQLDTISIFYPCEIKNFGPDYALSALWLPWSQITFFECSGAHSIADSHKVLSQCVALKECSVVVRVSRGGDHRQNIILPHLRTFRVAPFSGRVNWMAFLNPFILPSLEILACEHWALGPLEALVARSGCHPKELESFPEASFTEPWDAADLVKLLRKSPSLVRLKLTSNPLPPYIFNMISRGAFLPNITTLECFVDSDGLYAFLNLMERYSPGCGIHTGRISLYHRMDEEDDEYHRFLNARERYAAEGRDIRLEMISE